MTNVDKLISLCQSGMTEAEANLALKTVFRYREKVGRPTYRGAFDDFFNRLKVGDMFTVNDAVEAGTSTSRAYERVRSLLETGHLKVHSQGSSGRKGFPTIYTKLEDLEGH